MSIGVTGLLAMQRALDVTSHNIANASTDGYSRQNVEFAAVEPQFIGGSFVGRGVTIQDIRRASDNLLVGQATSASSTFSRLDAFTTNAQALSNLFADTQTGLATSLQAFTNSVSGVANDPTSSAARQVMLGQAESLRSRLGSYQTRLDEISTQINGQLDTEARTVTSIAQNIAKLNDLISTQAAISGHVPNDLLDARDTQLSELATHVNVTTVTQDNGSVTVMIGNGQPLVIGNRANAIVTQRDPYDPTRTMLGLQAGGTTIDVTSSMSGGTIGGLMDFRSQMLDPAKNQIGQIAIAVASVVNDQQAKGIDQKGVLGTDLFAVGAVQVFANTGNTQLTGPTVTRTSVSALTTNDYLLGYDGSSWTLRNAATGASVTMAGAGTNLSPFTADGLSIVVPAGVAAGDSFKIKPTAGAISGMSVLIADPSKIAAAAPMLAGAASANTGSGAITQGEVLDPTNAQLRATTTIQFIDATHYSVNGAGSFLYAAGSNIDLNGWRVAISGSPAAGDTFTVVDNTSGVGDNRNVLAMSQTLGSNVLNGGSDSVNSVTTKFVGQIGVTTGQAQTTLDAQKTILDSAKASVDAVSGVNLDEEAANMLRYQQIYQAAAQIIRVSQNMFDSLLSATAR
jgi:flagellar hook-associated protein 1 FlgK